VATQFQLNISYQNNAGNIFMGYSIGFIKGGQGISVNVRE
jgi:hypothetical protein